jgi:hypothetical protein
MKNLYKHSQTLREFKISAQLSSTHYNDATE